MPTFYFIISHRLQSARGSVQDSQLVILTHQVAELDIQVFKWNRFSLSSDIFLLSSGGGRWEWRWVWHACRPHYQTMAAFPLPDLEREEIVKSKTPQCCDLMRLARYVSSLIKISPIFVKLHLEFKPHCMMSKTWHEIFPDCLLVSANWRRVDSDSQQTLTFVCSEG